MHFHLIVLTVRVAPRAAEMSEELRREQREELKSLLARRLPPRRSGHLLGIAGQGTQKPA